MVGMSVFIAAVNEEETVEPGIDGIVKCRILV